MSEPEKTASSDRVIKLTIGERLALLNELPQRCGHITGLIVKDIMERLGTTQKDVEIYIFGAEVFGEKELSDEKAD